MKKNIQKRVLPAIMFAALSWIPAATQAQVVASVGGDLVSSYIWRGAYCGGVSIQPALSLSAGGFSLSAWGSVGFTAGYTEEYDFTLGYGTGGFSAAITDYWFNVSDNYFNYRSDETAHMFEATVAYDFGPLALSWNTFFAGNDFDSRGERAYSTYVQASVPFALGGVGMKAELGLTAWDGLYSDRLNVVNAGLTGSKEIRITDSFSVPAFTKVVFNPYGQQMYFVFGISL
ncbi:MAG: hypothetical protein LBK07_10990 [Tannerella sp.]|jgi:hypothetical protein|nr:hypothetical protein [Tannerella sp.]